MQFIYDNNITQIKPDPTTEFQNQRQQANQFSKQIINSKTNKFLFNTQSKDPTLNAYIKTHKKRLPIRPVINNKQAPIQYIDKLHNKNLKSFKY